MVMQPAGIHATDVHLDRMTMHRLEQTRPSGVLIPAWWAFGKILETGWEGHGLSTTRRSGAVPRLNTKKS